jgi:hypothetical protein
VDEDVERNVCRDERGEETKAGECVEEQAWNYPVVVVVVFTLVLRTLGSIVGIGIIIVENLLDFIGVADVDDGDLGHWNIKGAGPVEIGI